MVEESIFDEEELTEMAEEAKQLGWTFERYRRCLENMARPNPDKEALERAHRKVQEILAADREAAEAKKQSNEGKDE